VSRAREPFWDSEEDPLSRFGNLSVTCDEYAKFCSHGSGRIEISHRPQGGILKKWVHSQSDVTESLRRETPRCLAGDVRPTT
jgi:hypothetical protein